MRKVCFLLFSLLCIYGCGQSLEDKAAEEAQSFTRRSCPTPIENGYRTDSVTFDKANKEFTYYASFCDNLDNLEGVAKALPQLKEMLRNQLEGNIGTKSYRDAGFKFTYFIRSGSNPDMLFFTATYDYSKKSNE